MREKEPQFFRTEEKEIEKEISEKHREMLLILDDLHSSFTDEKIENYVVGGWAVECYSKKKTERDHHDIDYLIWKEDLEKIKSVLEQKHYEIIEGEIDREKKFHKFKHKLMARKEGVDIDFGFIEFDEKNNEVFGSAYPQFHFPKEFLNGEEAVFQNGLEQKSKFNIVSKELLLAMKINSKREQDIEDTEDLKREIGDEQKISEIQEKYSLDYENFKKEYEKEK